MSGEQILCFFFRRLGEGGTVRREVRTGTYSLEGSSKALSCWFEGFFSLLGKQEVIYNLNANFIYEELQFEDLRARLL